MHYSTVLVKFQTNLLKFYILEYYAQKTKNYSMIYMDSADWFFLLLLLFPLVISSIFIHYIFFINIIKYRNSLVSGAKIRTFFLNQFKIQQVTRKFIFRLQLTCLQNSLQTRFLPTIKKGKLQLFVLLEVRHL